ncbi:MAG: 3-hydroxyacyl-CoA dehydrogenase/enoyl-CoA hydratase family protein [Bryobacteraceae bacterium]
MKRLRRVAVLGAGTMGARIAAHFANAGYPALLLDIVLPGQTDRNAAAKRGIDAIIKQKPAAFFSQVETTLVTPGNFEDDLSQLSDCDWIVEAVVENLAIKRDLWAKVESVRHTDSIVSTNTSGIPLAAISDGFSTGFRQHFLGTHFFNPPRYLHLCEVIPGQDTDPAILAAAAEVIDHRLGKGVVPCNDTPNFIANRIGSFYGATVYKIMMEDGYTIEEVDALTGSLIGVPNTASFRLLDLVGIDIWAHVAGNLYDAVPDDPWRERFLPPPFLASMLERKWLGEKTGQGFYKKVGKGDDRIIYAIDWKTLEYHVADRPKFPSAEAVKPMEDLPARLRALLATNDRVGTFLWKLFSDVFLYSAERIPEIAGRPVEIDRAMRWGYANKLGPFELWDAVGFEATAKRIEAEGRTLPPSVVNMLSSGAKGFYRPADENGTPHTEYFDLCASTYRQIEARPGVISLADTKRARGVVKSNSGASLIDLGDGVLCLEFHSKMNALGGDQVSMIHAGIAETEKNFEAMVIANEGENFSVGANLVLVLLGAQEEEWDELNVAVHRFQQAMMAIKYAPKPVVVAPFARTLGGGCEVALHGARIQASAELYMGLVEAGVGVIPAGGGCKESILRLKDPRKMFETLGMAKVSMSAKEARDLRFLRLDDGISMNPERLIADAKAAALALVPNYKQGRPLTNIKVSGATGYSMMKLGAWMMRQGNYISDYDMVVAEKLAYVLSGGGLTGEPEVTEQYLLDLEREAFLSLLGNTKTQQRMQHTLKTGKPLRN